MKVILTLLVRDEADIIQQNIDYHLSRGIDFIIATDNLSVDGTNEILQEYERQGVLELIEEKQDDYAQSKWVTRMAQLAAKKYGADWVINSDADEFWWPETGTIQETLASFPESILAIQVERTNFVPIDDESDHPLRRMLVRERNSFNGKGKPLPPKVIHRGMADVQVGQGNHKIVMPDESMLGSSDQIVIFHYPLRTFQQLQNKIVLGGAAYERNMESTKRQGDVWKHLYSLHKESKLEEWYRSQIQSEELLRLGIMEGTLIEDHRLATYLKERGFL
ncbi:MAG: glycosyltransferase family 2 protein [Pirellulaceae bacterium]